MKTFSNYHFVHRHTSFFCDIIRIYEISMLILAMSNIPLPPAKAGGKGDTDLRLLIARQDIAPVEAFGSALLRWSVFVTAFFLLVIGRVKKLKATNCTLET
ncbi:MAG: hypothetical protein ABFS18_06045 [Thermodesulfobacteriota bacterium]